jgi:hypothetical protein
MSESIVTTFIFPEIAVADGGKLENTTDARFCNNDDRSGSGGPYAGLHGKEKLPLVPPWTTAPQNTPPPTIIAEYRFLGNPEYSHVRCVTILFVKVTVQIARPAD